jgi:hypothetical protein
VGGGSIDEREWWQWRDGRAVESVGKSIHAERGVPARTTTESDDATASKTSQHDKNDETERKGSNGKQEKKKKMSQTRATKRGTTAKQENRGKGTRHTQAIVLAIVEVVVGCVAPLPSTISK